MPCNIVRGSGIAAGLLVIVLAGQTSAQTRPRADAIPFSPKELERNLERFAEQMFGESLPEEKRVLAEVKISFEEERAFGARQVEAFMVDLQQQGIRIIPGSAEVPGGIDDDDATVEPAVSA